VVAHAHFVVGWTNMIFIDFLGVGELHKVNTQIE